tara:strand:- start:351 stop:1001 length:651 start_codon:yes stop_codon:yes gene_type:complete
MNNIYTKFFFGILILFITSNLKAESNYIKINYGLSSSEVGVTATSASGAITSDDEDQGYILSGGFIVGESWGVDFMYYDMGDTTITVTDDDIIKVDNSDFAVDTAGTINRNVTGAGIGLFLTGGAEEASFLSLDYSLKLGMHAWSQDGSTTLLDDNSGFKSKYYDEGIGAYSGISVGLNILNNTYLELAYDIIGVSSYGDFENTSSLLSAGLKVKF